MNLIPIPLSQLVAVENVRRTPATKEDDKRLRASIEAHGLLQNLVIKKGDAPPFNVVAGSRRLAALQAIHNEAGDDPDILCREVNGSDSAGPEAGLAENVIRAGMHFADEAEAVRTIREQGVSVKEVARRFGITTHRVSQLVRVSTVHPDLLNEARQGKYGLDEIQAFAVTPDQKAQLEASKKLKGWEKSAHGIRKALTAGWMDAKDALARLVGVAAYEKAGGKVERDLFDSQRRLTDPGLVKKLALEKLERVAAKLRKAGWKWVEVTTATSTWEMKDKFLQMRRGWQELTTAELARLDDLRTRINAFAPDVKPKDNPELAELEKEYQVLDQKRRSWLPWTPDEMAVGGCLVAVNYDGKPDVSEGLVRPEDRKALPASQKEQRDKEPSARSAPDRQKEAEQKAGIGPTLADRLRAVRKTVIRTAMGTAEAFGAAFDLIAFALCDELMRVRDYRDGKPLHIRCEDPGWRDDASRKGFGKGLPLTWAKSPSPAKRFAAFVKLADADKQRLFSMAVASQIRPQLAFDPLAAPEVEATAKRLGIAWEAAYRPDAEYWGALRKPALLDALTEVLGDDEADQRAKLPKKALVALLEQTFTGKGENGGDLAKSVLKRIAKWTPPGFRPGK